MPLIAPLAEVPTLGSGGAKETIFETSQKPIQWQLNNVNLIEVSLGVYQLQCTYLGIYDLPSKGKYVSGAEIRFIITSAPQCPATPY